MLDIKSQNLITEIIEALRKNNKITNEEIPLEKAIFEAYKKTNDLKGFWNNEGYGIIYPIANTNLGYNDTSKYDCCYRLILELFNVID